MPEKASLALRQGEAGPGQKTNRWGFLFSCVNSCCLVKRSSVPCPMIKNEHKTSKVAGYHPHTPQCLFIVGLCDTMRHPPMPSCRPFGDTKVEVHTTIDHSQQSCIRKHDASSMSASLRSILEHLPWGKHKINERKWQFEVAVWLDRSLHLPAFSYNISNINAISTSPRNISRHNVSYT